jgi:phosphoglycolate phosphatase-like HAD superfamily hydrolase
MRIATIVLLITISACRQPAAPVNTILENTRLSSWTEGPRQRIMGWVKDVTDTASRNFIPVKDRIAVFDNDGTLWPEQPLPNQLAFQLDMLKYAMANNPDVLKDPVIRAIATKDKKSLASFKLEDMQKVTQASWGTPTADSFLTMVRNWTDTAKDNRFGKRYIDMVYQPMIELLGYLRENGFKTFIVSGGGADFMRAWTEDIYGIPPYQVIGSYEDAKFVLADSLANVVKTGGKYFVDDKEGKPLAIHRFIGKRPVLCGGNSDGDLAMMQYTASSPYKTLNILLHHTDSTREYQYDVKTLSGHLEKALTEARARGWMVVDMKKDFGKVFPFE